MKAFLDSYLHFRSVHSKVPDIFKSTSYFYSVLHLPLMILECTNLNNCECVSSADMLNVTYCTYAELLIFKCEQIINVILWSDHFGLFYILIFFAC